VSRTGFRGDLDSRMLSWGRGDPPLPCRPRKYPEELLERGVRLALESGRPIAHVARDLGIHSETLRKRVRLASRSRPGLEAGSADERGARRDQTASARNFELRRANEILKSASVLFAEELDPRPTEVSRPSAGISITPMNAAVTSVLLTPSATCGPPRSRRTSKGEEARRAVRPWHALEPHVARPAAPRHSRLPRGRHRDHVLVGRSSWSL
jgi:transposase